MWGRETFSDIRVVAPGARTALVDGWQIDGEDAWSEPTVDVLWRRRGGAQSADESPPATQSPPFARGAASESPASNEPRSPPAEAAPNSERRGLGFGIRPFARGQKKDDLAPERDTYDFAPDSFRESSVTGEAAFGEHVGGATELEGAVDEVEFAAAWYPDPADSESIRYWDGSSWTNLVTPKLPPLWSIGDPATTGGTIQSEELVSIVDPEPSKNASVGPDRRETAQTWPPNGDTGAVTGWGPDPSGVHDGRYFENGEPTNRVRDGSRFFYESVTQESLQPAASLRISAVPDVPAPVATPVPAPAVNTGRTEVAPLPPLPPPSASARVTRASDVAPPPPADEGGDWVDKAESAVARAASIDTAETWRQAMQAAAVMSDMAKTMFAATEAEEIAHELAGAAEAAAARAAEAKRTAQRMAQTAESAAETARAAVEASAEAKQAAERSARAVSETAESSLVAAEAAAEAKDKAQELDAIVARARQANTPDAWSDALKLVTGGASAVDHRVPDSSS